MKFRINFLLTILLLSAHFLIAEDWFEATIILRSKKVIQGEISIKPGYEVILFRKGTECMVFPAHRIQSFFYNDKNSKTIRKFVSLQASEPATSYKLYEVMVEGKLSVLRRQTLVWYTIHQEVINYDYFLEKDNQIMPLRKFKNKVYPSLKKTFEGKLEAFVRENKLSPGRLSDTLRIIEAFNAFYQQENAIARN
jgi:hypothetical protein